MEGELLYLDYGLVVIILLLVLECLKRMAKRWVELEIHNTIILFNLIFKSMLIPWSLKSVRLNVD